MKLRYVTLNPSRIFNRLAPEHVTAWNRLPHEYRERWWDDDVIEVRQYFARCWVEEFDRITNHFTKLRESIKRDGIRHPISVVSGPLRNSATGMSLVEGHEQFLPPAFRRAASELIYTQPFGGSRLTIATELGITTIPAVIHDYADLFPDCEEVNRSNFKNWFGGYYLFSETSPHIRTVKQSHLEKCDKYGLFDLATRQAQQQAARTACERTKEKYG